MQIRIMRSKTFHPRLQVISRTSPAACPSCSQAAAVSSSAVSNACITPRKAEAERHLRRQMQTREKLAHRVQAHTALQPEGIERGDHQARKNRPAVLRLPRTRILGGCRGAS